jgi:hypothetical protein
MHVGLEGVVFAASALLGVIGRLSPSVLSIAAPHAVMTIVLAAVSLGASGVCWRLMKRAAGSSQGSWTARQLLQIVRSSPTTVAVPGWAALLLAMFALLIFGFWTGFFVVHIALRR